MTKTIKAKVEVAKLAKLAQEREIVNRKVFVKVKMSQMGAKVLRMLANGIGSDPAECGGELLEGELRDMVLAWVEG